MNTASDSSSAEMTSPMKRSSPRPPRDKPETGDEDKAPRRRVSRSNSSPHLLKNSGKLRANKELHTSLHHSPEKRSKAIRPASKKIDEEETDLSPTNRKTISSCSKPKRTEGNGTAEEAKKPQKRSSKATATSLTASTHSESTDDANLENLISSSKSPRKKPSSTTNSADNSFSNVSKDSSQKSKSSDQQRRSENGARRRPKTGELGSEEGRKRSSSRPRINSLGDGEPREARPASRPRPRRAHSDEERRPRTGEGSPPKRSSSRPRLKEPNDETKPRRRNSSKNLMEMLEPRENGTSNRKQSGDGMPVLVRSNSDSSLGMLAILEKKKEKEAKENAASDWDKIMKQSRTSETDAGRGGRRASVTAAARRMSTTNTNTLYRKASTSDATNKATTTTQVAPMASRRGSTTHGASSSAMRRMNRRASLGAAIAKLPRNTPVISDDLTEAESVAPVARKVIGRTMGSATMLIHVLQGRNLVAMDKDLLGRPTTSDPFVKAFVFENHNWKCVGTSDTVYKTINPVFQRGMFQVKLGCDQARALLRSGEKIELRLCDQDMLGNDEFMGCVQVPVVGSQSATWYRVMKRSRHHDLFSPGASGELLVSVDFIATAAPDVVPGSLLQLPNHITIGFSWGYQKVVAESACVALDEVGQVIPDQSIYFSRAVNPNQSIVKWGVLRSDQKIYCRPDGEEIWQMELEKVHKSVMSLFMVLCMPRDDLAALGVLKLRCINTDSDDGVCRFIPELSRGDTSMVLFRITRKDHSWELCPIGQGYPVIRECGSLLPQLHAFCRHTIPDNVPPARRSAWLRPGSCIRVEDYLEPNEIFVQIQWGTHYRVRLDSVITLLDRDFHKLDEVLFENPNSRDNSVLHCGGEGEEDDDDIPLGNYRDKIEVDLTRVSSRTMFICFSLGPYNGQVADPLLSLHCRIFGGDNHAAISYDVPEPTTWTGALIGCFLRTSVDSPWMFYVIGRPTEATNSSEVAHAFREEVKRSRLPTPGDLPEQLPCKLPPLVPVPKESIMIPEDFLLKVASIW
ncbi:hypothetical protein FisN_6Hh458 [Fistulifera solaris]|uniref:C2 domain-containing protein n=1 Tax=Fistulifera solaris TaxID=1519565 RepID=A0A1Z5K5K7_FISSO|nr:hypothetical protein FisN_6Hh458 [Fistulifera solaris]|eukprot:GAX21563.1 hypothetical protein FisN_6Hh458 [Fistulifera solaris]